MAGEEGLAEVVHRCMIEDGEGAGEVADGREEGEVVGAEGECQISAKFWLQRLSHHVESGTLFCTAFRMAPP